VPGQAWEWALGYALLAAVLVLGRWLRADPTAAH